MSCGTRLRPRFNSYSDREELAEKLENDGEYRLAQDVKHEVCLNDYDLRRAERSLSRQDMLRNFDYKEERCHCETEEE